MTNKLLSWFKRQLDRLKSLSARTIVFWVFMLVLTLLLITGTIYLIYWLLYFIVANIQLLMLGGFCLAAFIYWIKSRREERKKERQREEAKQTATTAQAQAQASSRGYETNYNLIRQALYSAINTTCDATGLNRIQSITALDTPRHFDSAGNYYVYHYMVTKTPGMVSLDVMQEILQNRIEQLLAARQIPGISQVRYFHSSGISYPTLIIDEIRDIGNFLQIEMVTANKHYAEFQENYLNTLQENTLSLQDDDF